jgi:hypothetical protein
VKPRRLHIDVDPPVVVEIEGHRVAFVGLNLLRSHVMVEYDVDPPLEVAFPGPRLVTVDVTDDTSDERYPTEWEDFPWRDVGPGRATTRLERRPPPHATCLRIVVRPASASAPAASGPGSSELGAVARFEVDLPAEHGLPWGA